MSAVLGKLRHYGLGAWRAAVLGREDTLICGLAITDRCNLSCRGCRVSNTGRPDMTLRQVSDALRSGYGIGCRDAYFSGGEPMLWRDGERGLEDAIAEARRVGYFHVHVYTNGTLGLDNTADLTWVSMDGLPGTFETRRGDHFAEVERAVRAGARGKVAIIYVIDRNTADGIEPFLRWVRETKLPVIGVMVYFHTPYYGYDELFLSAEERSPIIERLIGLRRAGLPLLNTRAGLRALESGRWRRRMHTAIVTDVDGTSYCCRAPDETCEDCGYAACTEIAEAVRLRPSAITGMLGYW